MVSSTGPVNQLVAAITSQLSKRGATPAAATPRQGRTRGAAAGGAQPDLSVVIGLRVKSLDRDDPQRGRKAFRVFLEAVLLSRFGDHLINDSQFHQLVDDIQGALEADPELNALVRRAIDALLASPKK